MAGELVELIRSRIDVDFDGECHLTKDEALSIIGLIEHLRAERDEARKRAIEDAVVVAENCPLNMPLMIGAAEGAARASLQIAAAIRNMGISN